MNPDKPLRGEVWYVDFNPVRGHEQGEKRPALVISADTFNAGPAGLVTVVPITSKDKRIPLHIAIQAPEAGLKKTSFAMPEQIRTVSKDRLSKGWGMVSNTTLAKVETMLRVLLDL
jgi:mRNA interferase MazF